MSDGKAYRKIKAIQAFRENRFRQSYINENLFECNHDNKEMSNLQDEIKEKFRKLSQPVELAESQAIEKQMNCGKKIENRKFTLICSKGYDKLLAKQQQQQQNIYIQKKNTSLNFRKRQQVQQNLNYLFETVNTMGNYKTASSFRKQTEVFIEEQEQKEHQRSNTFDLVVKDQSQTMNSNSIQRRNNISYMNYEGQWYDEQQKIMNQDENEQKDRVKQSVMNFLTNEHVQKLLNLRKRKLRDKNIGIIRQSVKKQNTSSNWLIQKSQHEMKIDINLLKQHIEQRNEFDSLLQFKFNIDKLVDDLGVQIQQKNVEQIIKIVVQSQVIFLQTQQTEGLQRVIYYLAEILFGLQEYHKALYYYQRLKVFCDLVKNVDIKIEAMIGISKCLRKFNELDLAYQVLKRALHYSWRINSEQQELELYNQISQVYFNKNDVKSAVYYHT